MKLNQSTVSDAIIFDSKKTVLSKNPKNSLVTNFANKNSVRFFYPETVDVFNLFLDNLRENDDDPSYIKSIGEFFNKNAIASIQCAKLEYSDYHKTIKLSKPKRNIKRISNILELRETIRNFDSKKLDLNNLSNILFWSSGVKLEQENILKRFYPSGGGLFPISIFVCLQTKNDQLTWYKYNPFEHTLIQVNDTPKYSYQEYAHMKNIEGIENTAMIAFGFNTRKSYYKYGNSSLIFSGIEIGAIVQNMHLNATAFNMGVCDLGGFNKNKIEDDLLLINKNDFHILHAQIIGGVKYDN